jgi:SAM-dependent methyltransferase
VKALSNNWPGEDPRIFSRLYYDRLFQIEDSHWWSIGMREIEGSILRAYLPDRQLDILDAGSGTGVMLTWLERLSRGGKLCGIDLAPDAIAYCKTRGHTQLGLGSVTELPFAEASFDLIHSGDVLQHLPPDSGPRRALSEAWRVLRPSGFLFVRTNSRPGRSKICSAQYQHFDRARVNRLMRAAGFTPIVSSYVNCLPSVVGEAKSLLRRARKSEQHGDQGLAIKLYPPHLSWLNRFMLSEVRCESFILNRIGVRLPFGHTVVCLARREP